MKRIYSLISVLLFFHCYTITAQNFEVTVLNKNSTPLPYAYILLNGKPVAVCDTLGNATIPIDKLSDNDTISVSYLGTTPMYVLYDDSVKDSKRHRFYMDDTICALNELIVVYQNPEKLFKNSVKKISEINYNCSMTAKLDANVISFDSIIRFVSATIMADNELWSKNFSARRYGWFHHQLIFNTKSDTIGVSRKIDLHTHFVLNLINRSLFLSRQNPLTSYKPVYAYLGEKDGKKVFRISYPKMYIGGCPYQMLLYVDKKTEHISSVEIAAMNIEPNKNTPFSKIYLKFDCEIFTNKKPRMDTVYLPVNIQYKAIMADASTMEFNITNVTLKYKKF
jgi:hypothetical protein